MRPATHIVRRARLLRVEVAEGGAGADGPHSIAPIEVAICGYRYRQPIANPRPGKREENNSHVARRDSEPACAVSVDARHGAGNAGAKVLERRIDEGTVVSVETTSAWSWELVGYWQHGARLSPRGDAYLSANNYRGG